MYGKYKVDMQGDKIFEGEYFESEILNEAYGDRPPQLYQNHANCAEEIENMTSFIETVSQILGLQKLENATEEIEKTEGRLNIKLPAVVKALYMAIDQNYTLASSKRRLLKPDELFVKDNVLAVMCHGKRKKTYLGIDLTENHSMLWEQGKGESDWEYEYCMESFSELMIQTAAMEAISKMPVSKNFKIKGYPTRELNAYKLLEEEFRPLFVRFEGYYNKYCAVMLNKETQSIAWLRVGEFASDIEIGSKNHDVIDQFKNIRGKDGYVEKIQNRK